MSESSNRKLLTRDLFANSGLNKLTGGLILTTLMTAAILIGSNLQAANVLCFPPTRRGWERHNINPWEVGTGATLTRPDPSLVLGTDWWWARSFEYHAVYGVDSTYGAMGAGAAKYIPLGQSSP